LRWTEKITVYVFSTTHCKEDPCLQIVLEVIIEILHDLQCFLIAFKKLIQRIITRSGKTESQTSAFSCISLFASRYISSLSPISQRTFLVKKVVYIVIW